MISEKQVDNIRVHHQIIFLKHPLVSGPKPDDSMPGEAANLKKKKKEKRKMNSHTDFWETSLHHLGFLDGNGCGLVAKLCLTLPIPWTVAHQTPLSIGFPRQEYWLPFPFPGTFP